MSNILAGKLAFVTGAGGGIGRAACRLLAKEGAKVIVTDENIKSAEETVLQLPGLDHIPIQVDVSSTSSVENAFKRTLDHYSRAPSIIVNSAGIIKENFILKMSEDEFDKVLDVNLKGTFLVMKTAVGLMIESKVTNGSVINISSIIGKKGNMGQANYSASKAGVIALTKTACMEFGKIGVRVNAVLPGMISTPMIENIPEKVMNMMFKQIPLGRTGEPDEVAELIVFLASEKSSYINGASIEITGGFN